MSSLNDSYPALLTALQSLGVCTHAGGIDGAGFTLSAPALNNFSLRIEYADLPAIAAEIQKLAAEHEAAFTD